MGLLGQNKKTTEGNDSDLDSEHFYKDLELFMYRQQIQRIESDDLISFSDKCSRNRWDFSYVIDFTRNEIIEPKGFELFLGYKEPEINPVLLIDGIHPEDVQLVGTLVKGVLKYLYQRPGLVPGSMMRVAYRRKHKEGHYVYLLNESRVRSADEQGRIRSVFSRNMDISFFGLHLPVQWSFTVNGKEDLKFKEEIFGEPKSIFTERELEILTLIKQGYMNREIAETLHISEHTVATHRKKIFRKSGTCGLDELFDFCRCHGVF